MFCLSCVGSLSHSACNNAVSGGTVDIDGRSPNLLLYDGGEGNLTNFAS